MEIEVIITPTAQLSFEKIKDYLLTLFTYKEYSRLLKELEKVVKLLKKGNVHFKYSYKTNTYKVVLHKLCSMYYKKVSDEQIDIVLFIDNRMMKGKENYE